MSIIQGTAKASGDDSFYDFPIGQSLRFDGSSYLSFTPSSNTNSGLWTYSVWVKLSDFSDGLLLGASPSSWQSDLRFSAGELQFFDDGGNNFNVESSMLFRDTSAFYHIVVAVNSSLSTDKIKIYVNGSVISFSTDSQTNFTLNDTTKFNNSSYAMRIGGRSSSVVVLKGYLAEINFIDGSALSPTSFGKTKNGLWIPKDPSGLTYGTNGFRLTFASSDFNTSGSAVTDPHGSSTTVPDGYVADASGSGNHWNVN